MSLSGFVSQWIRVAHSGSPGLSTTDVNDASNVLVGENKRIPMDFTFTIIMSSVHWTFHQSGSNIDEARYLDPGLGWGREGEVST